MPPHRGYPVCVLYPRFAGRNPANYPRNPGFWRTIKGAGLSFGFHLLAPFPGTEIREDSERYGIRILTDDWSQYHANRAIVETPAVDRKMLDAIVIGWEDEYNQLLGDIKRRMPLNTASAQEIEQLTNLERIVLVYDLMMKNIIEHNGSWLRGRKPMTAAENLKLLCEKISTTLDAAPQLIRDTLSLALQQGDLRCRQTDETIRWEWADYI